LNLWGGSSNHSRVRLVLYSEGKMNSIKTVALLGLLSGLLLLGGELVGGMNGLLLGLGLAVAMNFVSYFFSDKIALMMYSASPVSPQENPEVYRRVYPLVSNLTQRMGLPMPPFCTASNALPLPLLMMSPPV